MKITHKALCVLLSVFLLLPFASCKGSESGDPTEKDGTESTTTAEEQEEIIRPSIGNPSALGAESDENSILPTISINTDSGGMIWTKNYEGASVSVSDASLDECNFEDLRAEIKCRGNFSFGTDKKSYRIRFEEKINLFNQGRGPARSWVLLAEHCDQSFLRNHLTFAMANLLDNIAYVSSSSFVHLVINGQPQGIYHLAEQHQVQKNRVNINEDPEVIDTDYFIEWDAYAGEGGEEYGVEWFYCEENKFLVKSDSMTAEKCSFLQDYFQRAYSAIKSGKEKDIKEYIDIGSFIDMYILQETVKNIDVGWSSFFLVKEAGGKISCTCPWDFDLAFGNDERLDNGGYEKLYVGGSDAGKRVDLSQDNEWFLYLMKNTWFVDLVIERWNEVSSDMKDMALGEAERIFTCFGDEIAGNFDIWRIFGRKVNMEPWQIRELNTYEKHVKYLINWVTSRFEWMEDYFSNPDTKYQTTEY